MDSFINKEFKGLIIYSRFKIEVVGGNPFPQDRIWFSQDKPLYVSGGRGPEIFGENLSPRGWAGEADFGNIMVFHTIELRKALPFSIPIEFFGIKPGKITAALFQDTGQVDGDSWDQYPCCIPNSVIETLGYEIKIPLMISNTPILFFSYGEAQSLDAWKNEKKPNPYFQMSLVNPF